MARKGKWLTGVSPQLAAGEAARLALESRLYLVWRYLPLAAQRSDEDPEYVHQLRVATRRAMAALATFDEFLPRRRNERLTRRLKQVRKAAGAARDCDVLLARLKEQARQRPNPAWPAVLAHVEAQRREAQQPIARIHRRLDRKRFGRKIERFLKKVHFRRRPDAAGPNHNGHQVHGHNAASGAEPTFGQFARKSLRQIVDELFAAAGADLGEIAALHQLRIRGKHLRYAMELVAGAFDPALRDELYPTVERLQEKLGQVNDHAVGIATIQRLKESADGASCDGASCDVLDALILAERSALAQQCAKFREWWTPERAGELRQRFDDLLGSPPGEAPREDVTDAATVAAPSAGPEATRAEPELAADQPRD